MISLLCLVNFGSKDSWESGIKNHSSCKQCFSSIATSKKRFLVFCNPLYSCLCVIPVHPQVTIILLFSATGLRFGARQRQPNCLFKDPRITCVLAEKGRCPWVVESETAQPSLNSCHTTEVLSLVGLQESLQPCHWGAGHTLADLEESWLSYH